MLSGVTTVCFAGSYTVVFVLEISRLLFRSGIRGAIMIGFAAAGLLAHSAFLYYHVLKATGSPPPTEPPVSSGQYWCLLAAWCLVVVYLYLVYYHPRAPFGLFLMPLVLGLVGAGWWFAGREPLAREPALRTWGVIHGVSISLGAVSVLVGFAAGLMYLWQSRRLKHKLAPARGLRLPSLEWLDRTNSRAIVISVLMLGVGVVSGVILKFINIRSETAGLPWNDPVVLSTLVWFGWLLITVVAGKLYRPAQQGRKVAYLTVVSFVFLVIVLAVGLFVETHHWSRERIEDSGQKPVSTIHPPLSTIHYPLSSVHCPLSAVYPPPATGGAA